MALVSGSPSMSPSNSVIKAQRNGQTLIKVVMPLHTHLAMKKLGKNIRSIPLGNHISINIFNIGFEPYIQYCLPLLYLNPTVDSRNDSDMCLTPSVLHTENE